MNFLLDNNLPPALAKALYALSEREGHVVTHLREKFTPETSDTTWIGALQKEGNWVVISQDAFRKGNLEQQALRQCGLPVFCLAKHWSQVGFWDKAYNLVRWWPAIMEQSARIAGGAAFRVPWRYGKGRFEQLKL